MEQNGGKIPEGHVNAYTKARDAHNQKHGITSNAAPAKRASSPKDKREKSNRRANIKVLLAELDMDSDFSETESEHSKTEVCGALRAQTVPRTYLNVLTQPTPTKNRFKVFEDEDAVHEEEHVQALNEWAHKVTQVARFSKKNVPRREVPMNVMMNSQEDFDKVLGEMKDDEANPGRIEAITAMAKKLVIDEAACPGRMLGDGGLRVWC